MTYKYAGKREKAGTLGYTLMKNEKTLVKKFLGKKLGFSKIDMVPELCYDIISDYHSNKKSANRFVV